MNKCKDETMVSQCVVESQSAADIIIYSHHYHHHYFNHYRSHFSSEFEWLWFRFMGNAYGWPLAVAFKNDCTCVISLSPGTMSNNNLDTIHKHKHIHIHRPFIDVRQFICRRRFQQIFVLRGNLYLFWRCNSDSGADCRHHNCHHSVLNESILRIKGPNVQIMLNLSYASVLLLRQHSVLPLFSFSLI